MSDGTPIVQIRQVLFDERQHFSRGTPLPQHAPPVQKFQAPVVSAPQDDEPVNAPMVLAEPDVVKVVADRVAASAPSAASEVPKHPQSTARQLMNAIVLAMVVFVVMYLFPFFQNTPPEFRASPMKLLVISAVVGILVLAVQKKLA